MTGESSVITEKLVIRLWSHVISCHNTFSKNASREGEKREVGQGEVGGCHPPGESTWQLLWLAVEALVGSRWTISLLFSHKKA